MLCIGMLPQRPALTDSLIGCEAALQRWRNAASTRPPGQPWASMPSRVPEPQSQGQEPHLDPPATARNELRLGKLEAAQESRRPRTSVIDEAPCCLWLLHPGRRGMMDLRPPVVVYQGYVTIYIPVEAFNSFK